MPHRATQRADPLLPLPDLLVDLGTPPDMVFKNAGLSAADLAPGRFIPFAQVLRILNEAVALTGREDLGLLLGARHSLDVLGPLSRVMRSAATLGEALSDMVTLQHRNSSAAAIYAHRQKDQVFFGYGVHVPGLPVSPPLHDIVLAVGHRIIAELTRGAVRPREYLTMRPPPAEPARWDFLGATVRFAEVETGFYLTPADLAFPLPTANRERRTRDLRAMLATPPFVEHEFTLRTRHTLRCLLLEGLSGMPHIANRLGVGLRTMRRMLAREGTTFEEVRDGVRLAIAQELLSMSALPVGDLALTLDFATPSAFIHAFRRWTGDTPAAWRVRSRAQGLGAPTGGTQQDGANTSLDVGQ